MPDLEERTLFNFAVEEKPEPVMNEEDKRRKQMADEFREKYKIERDK